jgi:hypothetical protein
MALAISAMNACVVSLRNQLQIRARLRQSIDALWMVQILRYVFRLQNVTATLLEMRCVSWPLCRISEWRFKCGGGGDCAARLQAAVLTYPY